MCNRYRVRATPQEVRDLFNLSIGSESPAIDGEFYPGKPVPVVLELAGAPRRIETMTWGFPPFNGTKPINNTRSESAPASGYWKRHLATRCAFPLSAAVEWKQVTDTSTGEVKKVPHVISFKDGRLGAVAGIYMRSGDEMRCSMMTTKANKFWSSIHNKDPDDPRMICFLLDHASLGAWLDPSRSYDSVKELLRATPDDVELVAAPLGTTKPDNPSKPGKPKKDDKGGGLFG